MQQVALNRKNCTLLHVVPLTPAANPEECWWGTGKGDFGRKSTAKNQLHCSYSHHQQVTASLIIAR